MSLQMPAVLAQITSPAAPGGNTLFNLFPFLVILVVFYFLLILPARRKQKKHQTMLDNLKSGDRVVTSGGIYGTIVGVTDQLVQLRIADQVKIEVAKHAIAGLQQREE